MPWTMSTWTRAFIRQKYKVARNEKRGKATSGFCIYKIWQILKRFAGTFRRTQTLKLVGVILFLGRLNLLLKSKLARLL